MRVNSLLQNHYSSFIRMEQHWGRAVPKQCYAVMSRQVIMYLQNSSWSVGQSSRFEAPDLASWVHVLEMRCTSDRVAAGGMGLKD